MAVDRTLTVASKPIVQSLYRVVDQPENPEGILDNLNYEDLFLDLINGNSGDNQVDIQYHERRINNTETETIDLSADLTNVWEDALNFAATKYILIFNRNASTGHLTIAYKDERYRPGPQGARVVGDPISGGLTQAVGSSNIMTITGDESITYDLIIIGSTGT